MLIREKILFVKTLIEKGGKMKIAELLTMNTLNIK